VYVCVRACVRASVFVSATELRLVSDKNYLT
jgi:hypothetical protein